MAVIGARLSDRYEIVRELGLYDYWRKSGKWGDFVRPRGDDDFEVFAGYDQRIAACNIELLQQRGDGRRCRCTPIRDGARSAG